MRFHSFVFTGKEKDEETGYGYFGERYMDHELMTMWLSVDPLADKYPSISPYAYCAWNPLKLVDPNGEEAIASDDWYKNKETGAALWREGHAESITLNGDTYDNIGESYSHPMADGQYVNYYQNCPLTIGQERDVTQLAHEDQSCRTSLIRTRSILPDSHKKDLFNSHVASRGIYPYHSTEGGFGLGIDATFCGIIGINVHGGIYRDNCGGWGLYGGVNYCTGMEVGLSVGATRVPIGHGFSGENQIVGGGFIVSGSYNIMSNSRSTAISPSKLGFNVGLSTKIGRTWCTPAIRLF